MDWYQFCQQSVADNRVFGLVKGFLEIQLGAQEWTAPLSREFTATLHEENRLSGITAREKSCLVKPPGKLVRQSQKCTERRQWPVVLHAPTNNTIGDERG